jgi:sugar lactone lactonase YvrE
MAFALFLACLLGVPIPLLAAPGDITTVAGGVGQGPALSIAQAPAAVVVSGPFVYVADSVHHVVRRVDTRTGREIVVAGNGFAGFNGDGGPATVAQLNNPSGVALDAAGNLFIADGRNNRIRRVDAAGTITTVAGGGSEGLGDGGPATSAQLSAPIGVAVDAAGNLSIADSGNRRIRMVDSSGTITTIAGGVGHGHALSIGQVPMGVVVFGPFVYLADSVYSVVRRLDTRTGSEIVVAGTGTTGFGGDGGPATSAQLNFSFGTAPGAIPPGGALAMDAAGNLFIADTQNNRIRKVDTAGTITTVAGGRFACFGLGDGGPATSANLVRPFGVAVDTAGNLFIADVGNHRIRKVDTAGTITTVAGTTGPYCNSDGGFSGDGGPATSAQLNYPLDVAVDSAGNLFIADLDNQRIRKVDTAGIITTVAGSDTKWCGFYYCGGFSGDGGAATSAQFNAPAAVAVDAAGNLFIADVANNRIRKVDPTGIITTVAGTGPADCGPYAGCTGDFGGDGGPATGAQLSGPWGVAVDTAGNLFIADTGNQRLREVDTAGTIATVGGNGLVGRSGDGGPATSAELNGPAGVALDTAGNLFNC